MPYDGQLLARARAQLDRIRAENEAEHQRRVSLCYARVPELQRTDEQMRRQMSELVRLTITPPADLRARIEALEEENLDAQMRRAELLEENGWSADYLDEIVSCPICRDSGMDGGRPCRCLEALYNAELTEELSTLLRRGDESFERFDPLLYSDLPPAPGVPSPREAMALVCKSCRKFADNFPAVSANLLLYGGTGLGKTYLSACIARVVAGKGYSVCYDSAAAALEAFERQKFARDPAEQEAAAARVRRMLSCDLMILDDLGTEMITPVSKSALYTLLNDRLVNGRRIILNTNLSPARLGELYSPQIASRIDGEFLHLPFVGEDIRRKKKGV